MCTTTLAAHLGPLSHRSHHVLAERSAEFRAAARGYSRQAVRRCAACGIRLRCEPKLARSRGCGLGLGLGRLALTLLLRPPGLTTTRVGSLAPLVGRHTLRHPPRDVLRIPGMTLQLVGTGTRVRPPTTRRVEHRLTHPVTLLVQHPLPRHHPQPAPRPRTQARHNLPLTQLRHEGINLMRWDHARPLPTTRELGVKLLHQPDTHELDVNTLPVLLTQPVSQQPLRTREKLLSRHTRHTHQDQPPFSLVDKTARNRSRPLLINP